MSEPRPLPSRYYVVGDEIRVRAEVRHQFNVEEVRLIYERDVHPGGTITLIGEPDSTPPPPRCVAPASTSPPA